MDPASVQRGLDLISVLLSRFRPNARFSRREEARHDRIGENWFAKYSPYHEWWYYPLMTREEVVLIKQWDSAGGLAQSGGVHPDSSGDNGDAPCTLSFHTAFTDPNTPTDAPGRQS